MISIQDKIDFVNNMSIMLKAGISIEETLAMLHRQTKSKAFKKLQAGIISKIRSGMPMADAILMFSPCF